MATWTIETVVGSTAAIAPKWRNDVALLYWFNGSDFTTSPDGITWSVVGTAPEPFADVVWAGTFYVAVAAAGDAMTSPDGVTWTQQPVTNSYLKPGMHWASGSSLVIAIADSGLTPSGEVFATSPDGVTWTPRLVSSLGTTRFVGYAESLDRLVSFGQAPGETTSDPLVVVTSDDGGVTWTDRSFPSDVYDGGNDLAIRWHPNVGLFTCLITTSVSPSPLENTVVTSPDGVTWTVQTVPPVGGGAEPDWNWYGIVEVSSVPMLLAVGYDFAVGDPGKQFFMSSTDGASWTLFPATGVSFDYFGGDIVYISSLDSVAVYDGGTLVLTGEAFGSISITAVTPDIGGLAGGDTVEITGTAFDPDVEVLFDQIFALSVTWNSATSLTVVTPPHAEGVVTVTVTNPNGDYDEGVGLFEYADADSPFGAPFITSVTPNSGPMSGGTAVTIIGGGFNPGAIVLFEDTPATSVVVVSDTEITCVTPAHPVELVDVRVIT